MPGFTGAVGPTVEVIKLQDRERPLLESEDYLLLGVVLLLPWAFGGVDLSAYRAAGLTLVAAACIALWKRGWPGWGLVRGEGWLLPAFLLAMLAALQLIPVPPSVVRGISPAAHRIYADVFPDYEGGSTETPILELETRALAALPESAVVPLPMNATGDVQLETPECYSRRWRTLSLEPGATLERLAWFAALLLGFLVLRERVALRERQRVYLWGLFVNFGALAIFGLVQREWWAGEIYWYRTVLVPVFPFGPYFNPNHFAAVMELAVPMLAGYALLRLRRAGRSALYEAGFGISVVAAAACLVAGFATASKYGAVLIPAGLVVLVFLSVKSRRGRLAVLVGAALLVVVAVGILSGTHLGDRFEDYLGRTEGSLLEGRTVIWKASVDMVRDFPVVGAGFGSFRHVFAGYVPAGENRRWAHAHNDDLELVLDGGAVALVLLIWLACGFGVRVVARYRRIPSVSPVHLGLLIGLLSLTVHAFIDFNHQIPANALLFAACCALLLPFSGGSSKESGGGNPSRAIAVALMFPLLAFYGYRTVVGFPASWYLERGHRVRNQGRWNAAGPLLDQAAVGSERTRALLMAGDARMVRWKHHQRRRGAVGADRQALLDAAGNFFDAQCGAPASREARLGLSDVYHAIERIGRERRSESPFVPTDEPWSRVGRPGRITLGMLRLALEAYPNWSRIHDRLAMIQWSFGLDEEARRSVRDSARSLPLYNQHPYGHRSRLPKWFGTEFADASREVLGQVPLFPQTHHLIDLGKLERRNGNNDRAIATLQEALGRRMSEIMRAECNFHLGLALADSGRSEEGIVHLERSREHPVFGISALRALAAQAERNGHDDQALEYLRRLRREQPGALEPCLRFATVATRVQDWPAALESLRWAKLRHPTDPRPYAALVEVSIAKGDRTAAKEALEEFRKTDLDPGRVETLERALRSR